MTCNEPLQTYSKGASHPINSTQRSLTTMVQHHSMDLTKRFQLPPPPPAPRQGAINSNSNFQQVFNDLPVWRTVR